MNKKLQISQVVSELVSVNIELRQKINLSN
ncbi:hypothetical protein VCSRO127_3116 [Vibrio cholerae]|nr:hypothetical protein VCSRO127_3116 [Vibrio cholerae]GIB47130.1 hypothetical protein VCSRO92_2962 [Vibrio cholerae]